MLTNFRLWWYTRVTPLYTKETPLFEVLIYELLDRGAVLHRLNFLEVAGLWLLHAPISGRRFDRFMQYLLRDGYVKVSTTTVRNEVDSRTEFVYVYRRK